MKLYVTGQATVTLSIKELFPYSWWLEWHRMDSTYQTTLHCVDFDSLAYLSIISQKNHGWDVFKTTIQKSLGISYFLKQWWFPRAFMTYVGHKSENHSIVKVRKDL